jgi:hypothetical protein
MTRFVILSVALALAVPAAAQDQAQPAADPLAPTASPAAPKDADVSKKVAECAGEKFVFAWGAGSSPTKVTLCGDKGASHEEVVRMLEDAAGKLERATGIPEDRRIVLVQQIRGKIAELEKVRAAKAPLSADSGPRTAAVPGVTPLKPLPRPTASATTGSSLSSALLLPKPKLAFECYTPGDLGVGGPCVALNRETRLTVKAGEAIPAATSLRFTRRGEFRTEVQLGPMRKGQSRRLVMPREVCGGVVETEIQIQVARGSHPVDTRGPYLMRC